MDPNPTDPIIGSPSSITNESLVSSPRDKRRFTCYTHNLADIPFILENSNIIVTPQSPGLNPRRQKSLSALVKKLATELVAGSGSRKKKT